MTGGRRRSTVAAAAGLAVLLAACSGSGGGDRSGTGRDGSTAPARGGSVAVAVWADPDPAGSGLGAAAVRDLTLPQLFEPTPRGTWTEGLVAPGSVRESGDRRSASFRLRPGAVWSDGRPITVDDLRRTADARWVAGVDGPAPDGTVTVRFTGPLPGWRRLWSWPDAVTAPADGLAGGPFRVERVTPGLETVLRRNDRWYGGATPLDEVRLVLVPDSTTARQLLDRGDLDVVAPLPATVRTEQLRAVDGVEVASADASGTWTALVLNPARLPPEVRRAVVATVDRDAFVATLLQGEARPVATLAPGAAPWAAVAAGDQSALRGQTVELTLVAEEPMAPLLARASQKRAKAVEGTLELRTAEHRRVETWLAEGAYGAAVVPFVDPPGVCWTCRWGGVAGAEAAAADAGGSAEAAALQTKLRDDALVLPLWRGPSVVAFSQRVLGVEPNGFAPSAAWNADRWSLRR